MSRRIVPMLLLFTVSLVCVALGLDAWDAAIGQAPQVPTSKMLALLEQKRDVLKQRLDAIDSQFKIGLGSQDTVFAARDDLLEAELALASDKPQRVAVLEKRLANAKEYEQLILQRRQVGSPSVKLADDFMATAKRLEAEIALLREQES